jgi:hypothetical protein
MLTDTDIEDIIKGPSIEELLMGHPINEEEEDDEEEE